MRPLRLILLAVLLAGCGNSATGPDNHANSDGGDGADLPPVNAAVLRGPSRGSAIALSPDDSVAVVVNRDVGTVTVLALAYPAGATPTETKIAEVDVSLAVGVNGEPWQAVVAPDNDTAFVVTRRDQRLVRIDHLKTAPVKGAVATVGAEPTGVALTPTGKSAFVANWVDGTLSQVDTATMTVARTIDLNATLAGSGLLGTVAARPALAHPRALTITNNLDGNDADESIYVTEFYAQRKEVEIASALNADVAKQGIVYKVSLSDDKVAMISLAPIADIGFKDHNNGVAGCYPNQLLSVTINSGYAYVTSVCASPEGPTGPFVKDPKAGCTVAATDCPAPAGVTATCTNNVCSTNCASNADCEANGGKCDLTKGLCAANVADVKTTTSPVISVIDLKTDTELTAGTANLNARFQAFYDQQKLPDDNSRRFPLIADDVAFVPGTSISYVSASGADGVFRVRYDAGVINEVGSSTSPFINLTPAGITPPEAAGRSPVGIAITNLDHGARSFAFTANDITRNLSAIDLAVQAVAGGVTKPSVIATTALPGTGSPAEKILLGKRFFNTGTARWSLNGQAWGACQACHIDGLTDNVTWYFARGPRQSISLDGTWASKNPADQRALNWTAIFDELADFENNVRGVSGGVGAIVSNVPAAPAAPTNADRIDIAKLGHSGLSGSALSASSKTDVPDNFVGFTGKLDDWANMTEYGRSLRSPRAPSTLDAQKVAAGRALFEAGNCQGCHGGDKWTLSRVFYTPDKNVTNLANNTNAKLLTAAWAPPVGLPQAVLPALNNRFMRFLGADPTKAAAFEQIQCVLRPVGTFGVAEPEVAENGKLPELRIDMTKKAQGEEADGNGFNPPSLLNVSTGAPYLHGGQVRTLEGLFSPTFKTHYQALSSIFLDATDTARAGKIDSLVQFLLSIDEDTPVEDLPKPAGATGGDFCAAPM